MTVHIVTHCYQDRGMSSPVYAKLLHYQLSSLVLREPDCTTCYWLCCAEPDDDPYTEQVIEFFDRNGRIRDTQVQFNILRQPLGELFRRSIGRNFVCKELAGAGQDHVVWFADADYGFLDHCLDELDRLAMERQLPVVGYPAKYWIHVDHSTGDRALSRVDWNQLSWLDASEFMERKGRPIGGMMLVRGDFLKYGYCENSRWQKPVDPKQVFKSFADDIAYRNVAKSMGHSWTQVHIPNVFRLRHSESSLGTHKT